MARLYGDIQGDIPAQISIITQSLDTTHHATQRHQRDINRLIHIPRPHCLTAKWEPNYTDHVPSPHDAGVVSAGTAVVTETAYHQLCGDCSVSTSCAVSRVFVWSLWSMRSFPHRTATGHHSQPVPSLYWQARVHNASPKSKPSPALSKSNKKGKVQFRLGTFTKIFWTWACQ